jgi:hypothetical protein
MPTQLGAKPVLQGPCQMDRFSVDRCATEVYGDDWENWWGF